MPPAIVQPPQFARSLVVSTHTPLQSSVPFGHSHLPALHVMPPLHAMSQPPQFAPSVCVSTQDAPHFVRFASHVALQSPFEQTWPALHATAVHAPQCCGSLFRSTHAPQLSGSLVRRTHEPPQSTLPLELPPSFAPASGFGSQLPAVQTPALHTSPFAHFVPQPPQLRRSTVTSVHWPLHSIWPMAQPHLPPMQVVPPMQAFPHAPQSRSSVFVSTHEPLQFVRPVAQPAAHAPWLQTPCVPVQAVPHVPQLFSSLPVSTHDWPHFVRPALHVSVHCPRLQT